MEYIIPIQLISIISELPLIVFISCRKSLYVYLIVRIHLYHENDWKMDPCTLFQLHTHQNNSPSHQ